MFGCIWNGSLLRYGNLYVVSKGMLPRFQLGFLLANRTWKFAEKNHLSALEQKLGVTAMILSDIRMNERN